MPRHDASYAHSVVPMMQSRMFTRCDARILIYRCGSKEHVVHNGEKACTRLRWGKRKETDHIEVMDVSYGRRGRGILKYRIFSNLIRARI